MLNIVKPYAKIIQIDGHTPSLEAGINALKHVEWCGRISHRSEEAQTEDSWDRFIRAVVLGHGDWSIVEHVNVGVDFLVDRGITHEIVRHRLFSFTQESTRFVNYDKKMAASFIMPEGLDDEENLLPNEEKTHISQRWMQAISTAESCYQGMVRNRVAPQIARSVFPNALASRLIVTGNLRNWRHFFIMRTTKEAHPQMRQVTIPLLADFKKWIPILFEDIEPMAKQSEGMRKGR